jgi:hypothetical protein
MAFTGRIPQRYAGRPLVGDGLLGAGAEGLEGASKPSRSRGTNRHYARGAGYRRPGPTGPQGIPGEAPEAAARGARPARTSPQLAISGVIDTHVFRVLPRGKNLKENNGRRAKMAPPEAFRGWILPAKKVSKIKGRKGGGANDAVLLDLVGLTRTGQPHAAPG